VLLPVSWHTLVGYHVLYTDSERRQECPRPGFKPMFTEGTSQLGASSLHSKLGVPGWEFSGLTCGLEVDGTFGEGPRKFARLYMDE